MAKKKNYDRTGEKGLYHVLSVLMIIDIVVVVLGAIGIGAGTVFSTAIENTFPNVPIVGISAGLFIVAGIILIPMLKARWKFKQAFYDEFGMDENGNYNRKLSGMERREMDVQRIADTERILSREQAEKMSKPGSKNPREDMKELIGMNSVKMRMEEMVARMEYDRQSVKDRKVKKDDATGAISSRHMCFLGNPGTGKAQPLYSKVLTPDGFVQMKDIRVGDTVIAADGTPSKVLGVYPQGIKPIYEITFDDGSVCRCSDEHLWTVQTPMDRKFGKYRTIELKEILKKGLFIGKDKKKRYAIDYVRPVQFNERNLPLHPYLLGLLIGDGCLEKNSVSISLYDEQLKKDIQKVLPEGYSLHKNSKKENIKDYNLTSSKKASFRDEKRPWVHYKELNYRLYQLGLCGKKSYEKFIPKEYLYSSIEQRKWLLKGLLDTDGYVDRSGIEFSTTSEQLKTDIIELVKSLGGYATFKKRDGKHKKDGQVIKTRKNYRVCIQFPSDNCDCFNLKRKSKKYNPKRDSRLFRKCISNIKYIGEEECQCIYIDNPEHLYVTDDYIVTHNTTVARIMTGFFYENGYIKENKYVETDGNFLKASNPTDTARKTELICRQAYNGVLFIDEAYALNSGMDGCGEEAIATLIKQMEDHKDKFILILAGYTRPMKELIAVNPGFESRIKDFLIFPDYTVEELGQIFSMMANQRNLVVTAEGMNNFYERIRVEIPKQGFGNARTVRNILDECIDRHAINLKRGIITENDRYKICSPDVSQSPKPMFQMHYTK